MESKKADDLPFLSYPIKYHVEASRDDMVLKLDITSLNVCEIVWKFGRSGMFEGSCYATGTLSWADNTVELNGYGMSEVTRVKYFLDNFRIFNRLMERLFTSLLKIK